jgi:hypothetical protein
VLQKSLFDQPFNHFVGGNRRYTQALCDKGHADRALIVTQFGHGLQIHFDRFVAGCVCSQGNPIKNYKVNLILKSRVYHASDKCHLIYQQMSYRENLEGARLSIPGLLCASAKTEPFSSFKVPGRRHSATISISF